MLGDPRGSIPAREGVALLAHDFALVTALRESSHLHSPEEHGYAPRLVKRHTWYFVRFLQLYRY